MTLAAPVRLIPRPRSVQRDEGWMALTPASRILVDATDAGARATAALLADAVALLTGWRPAVTADSAIPGDIVLDSTSASTHGAEGYAVHVADHVTLSAAAPPGLFYAAQTLRQLLVQETVRGRIPRVTIADAPRFAYRGVMIDVARTFFDVDDVTGLIDRASALKFNHLHLHLTDDQGWRLDISRRPRLSRFASQTAVSDRPGGFFSAQDYHRILAYAAARHMVVVPEIDLPGHTHAIGLAYPEVVEPPALSDDLRAEAARRGQDLPRWGEPYRGWGVGHSSVRIPSAATDDFVRDVLTEVAELTPGPYLHVGGDEALRTPRVEYDRFLAGVTALVRSLGKTPIVWHEGGSAPVAPGTVGQYWGSTDPNDVQTARAHRFIERGGRLLLSPSNTAYLDQAYDDDCTLGLTWAGPIDLRTARDWEPTAVLPGIAEDQILGVEAPLWTETTASLADVDQLFFPRAAAIAEVAWSPRGGSDTTATFLESMRPITAVWDAAGWGRYRPVSPSEVRS